jgi:FAD:protein FMN transferase
VIAHAVQPFRHLWRAMGSPCELQLFAVRERDARRARDAVVAEVERFEQRYSRYRADSLLSSINRVAAAGGALDVDAETASLLDYADTCHRESDGLFDITSGVLREAWDFRSDRLPDPGSVAAAIARVGWEKVAWRRPRLAFAVPGMEIDLGGVVKEYAADRAAQLCREAGVESGMVNLGGDIAIVGPRPGGEPWRIGIRHPRAADEVMRVVGLARGGLASSGDYERSVVVDGVRYGHILNPKTGWPVRRMAGVTVVAALCVVAGSASTIAMLKEEEGPAWLASVGLPCLWFDVDGAIGGTLA